MTNIKINVTGVGLKRLVDIEILIKGKRGNRRNAD